MSNRKCPLCGNSKHIHLEVYSRNEWKNAKCVTCDFIFLSNPVSYNALRDEQAWESNAVKETGYRRKNRPILDLISKKTRFRLRLGGKNKKSNLLLRIFKKGCIVDIGCGAGTSLPVPLIPYGIEISKNLSNIANNYMQKRGGKCINEPAIDGLKECEDLYFDGVLLNSFLEHEINPLLLLQEVHRVLKDNGVVYVRVPNFGSVNRMVMRHNWCGLRFPDHVNYFTTKTLGAMCQKSGFKMKIMNPFNIYFDDNIKATLSKI